MKPKFPRAIALSAARELCGGLKTACDRLIVAGSLRRNKAAVGDIEIVFIPKMETVQTDLITVGQLPATDKALLNLIGWGIIKKRLNKMGSETWGEQNKYAVHVATGVPVDFFRARESNWWNYLVCRTGSAESNMKIATAALAKGWQWHPTGKGFCDERGEVVSVNSEREVFELVGLPYREPHLR